MSEPINLAVRRFDAASFPEELQPTDALHAALAEVVNDDLRHIIVCVARKTDNSGCAYRYFQAGDYDAAGQVGLLRLIQDQILDL